jgi:hypothetical protein
MSVRIGRGIDFMAGATKRTITLTQDEAERLRQRAHELGVPEETLLRKALRQALSEGMSSGDPAEDPDEGRREWEQVLALMRARAGVAVPTEEQTTSRGWTREEIYDERFDRRSR